jgi:tRNA nucleotidyltransferase (CCA-adding enzyme)
MSWRREVLKKFKPSITEERKLRQVARKVMKLVSIPNVKMEIGGSSAKGTWLKGHHDLDIYVKFDSKIYGKKNISKILIESLRPYDFEVLHGSRDYVQLNFEGFEVELIPIIEIKKVEQACNITDISPFHKKWVRKHKQYCDEIRIAKVFAKCNNLYGAESYIKGFSGYAIECLVIYYRGFIPMIEAVAKWDKKTLLDYSDFHKGKVKLNASKMQSPIVVVDPVQSTRNVTAVVSKERYDLFKQSAKGFLKNPSISWFVKDEFSLAKLKRTRSKLIWIKVSALSGKKDVVGAKLLKVYDFLRIELMENDFNLLDSGWHWGESTIFWFKIGKEELSKKVKHFGPEATHKNRLESFKKKWVGKKVYTENQISYILKDREYTDAFSLLEEQLKKDYVQCRVKEVHDINQKK